MEGDPIRGGMTGPSESGSGGKTQPRRGRRRIAASVGTPYYCAAETIFSAKLRLMDDKRNMMGYAPFRREVPP
ncbi:MAG TPA: hypothetical protein VMQ11_18720 [Alphaproteobacteria bacterium]|nr:hypothetical protein [Alphaproteobacteria bacterium]